MARPRQQEGAGVNRSRLKQQLREHEGMRRKPYHDSVSGKLTIGVGRNLDDVGITEDEAEVLLDNDIVVAWRGCQRVVPGFDVLDEARQHALMDMAFNLGETRLSGFKKMLAAVEAREWDRAADEMLASTWAKQVGRRAEALATMMRSGS